MSWQGTVGCGNARRLVPGRGTTRWYKLQFVISCAQVEVADRSVPVLDASIRRHKRNVVSRTKIQSQSIRDSPLVLKEEAIHPAAVLRFELVPVGIACRNSHHERSQAEASCAR